GAGLRRAAARPAAAAAAPLPKTARTTGGDVVSAERKARWRSVLRLTARNPLWLGYWLRRHRRTETLTPRALARRRGIALDPLRVLGLSGPPRGEQFQAALAPVGRRSGADKSAWAALLRRERGLARWGGAPPPPARGWLMAAPARSPPPPPPEPEPP